MRQFQTGLFFKLLLKICIALSYFYSLHVQQFPSPCTSSGGCVQSLSSSSSAITLERDRRLSLADKISSSSPSSVYPCLLPEAVPVRSTRHCSFNGTPEDFLLPASLLALLNGESRMIKFTHAECAFLLQ